MWTQHKIPLMNNARLRPSRPSVRRPQQTYIARGRHSHRSRSAPEQHGPHQTAECVDHLAPNPSVVTGFPTATEFIRAIRKELRIRFYQPTTIKTYMQAITSFLRWYGGKPHRLTREHVREYLFYLVAGNAGSSTVANHLSAIRTVFDKMCQRSITFGLAIPRKPRKLPVVLSAEEVTRLLEAAPSRRDKLLLGMMYATGMRVSEVVRVRMKDIDFDREVINVWQGKGRADRQVQLPSSFQPLFQALVNAGEGDNFLFAGEQKHRHISPRTVQRIMKRALAAAGILKHATPHSLRHSFATHSFEQGCDIRRIQKLLGHIRLETTTIYVKVAAPPDRKTISPIDRLPLKNRPERTIAGKMRFYFKFETCTKLPQAKVTIAVLNPDGPLYFTGIRIEETRPGFATLRIPPLEDWQKPHSWLTRQQQERFKTPEFYELLRRQITQRFMHLKFQQSQQRI